MGSWSWVPHTHIYSLCWAHELRDPRFPAHRAVTPPASTPGSITHVHHHHPLSCLHHLLSSLLSSSSVSITDHHHCLLGGRNGATVCWLPAAAAATTGLTLLLSPLQPLLFIEEWLVGMSCHCHATYLQSSLPICIIIITFNFIIS